jgi:hypothetical protein
MKKTMLLLHSRDKLKTSVELDSSKLKELITEAEKYCKEEQITPLELSRFKQHLKEAALWIG